MHLDMTTSRARPTTIRIEKHIPAPPEQVFAAWTDPSQWADWYAPSDDFGPSIGEADLQVGGHYRIGMLLPGQSDPQVRLRAILPGGCAGDPELHLGPGTPHARSVETQVTLEFHPRGEAPISC